jgi:16S rRNA (guanine527-N7)-methyltransferase
MTVVGTKERTAFAARFDVPRETLDRLAVYEGLLRKWNAAINLVAPASLGQLWERHFADSAQLLPLIPRASRGLVDLGSGAGFPGLVLAILGVPDVHLVESDTRKATFLREAARATGTAATVHAARAETVSGVFADVVTARALAPISDLLPLAVRFLRPGGVCLFLKGRTVESELTQTGESWTMTIERFPSVTDPSGTVVRLSEIARVL